MRLNLGSGKYPLEGYTNVDSHEPAEVQGDVRELDFSAVEEVRMSHLLEHISWRQTVDVLSRIRSWMKPLSVLTVEVPDMETILDLGTVHPLWFKYVYGDQSHDGEYHLAGFTRKSLIHSLQEAGYQVLTMESFLSTHKGREGMPCLEATASA